MTEKLKQIVDTTRGHLNEKKARGEALTPEEMSADCVIA